MNLSTKQVLDKLEPEVRTNSFNSNVKSARGASGRIPGVTHIGPGEDVETQDEIIGTLHGVVPSRGNSHKERRFEQFWHKSAAVLFATGYTAKQVAETLGLSSTAVSDIHKTSWFQEMVTKLIIDNGGKDLIEAFRRDSVTAFAQLVEIRMDPMTPKTLVAKLCTDSLERVYGKATVRIEHSEAHSDDPVAEVSRLKKENDLLLAAQQPSLS